MKKLNLTRTLLSVALTGAFAIAPFMAPTAQAAPPRYAPAYGYRAKDKKHDKNKKQKKEERREERYERDHSSNNNRTAISLSGTVTNVRTGSSFDLRTNSRTYTVYTSASLPRGLSRGDQVQVSGRAYSSNDIRNASVRITSNNRPNVRPTTRPNNGNGQNYRNYSGTVSAVRNDREFDVRIDGKTYNVYAVSGTRNLNKNDEVRVYGTRFGDNDIRNARVTITRNR